MATRIERRSTIITILPGRPGIRKVTTAGKVKPKRLLAGKVEVYDVFGRLRTLPQSLDDPIIRPEIRLSWDLPKPLGPAQYPASYDYAYQTLVRRNQRTIAKIRPNVTTYSDRNPADGPNNYEVCLQGLSQSGIENVNCGDPTFFLADLTRPIPPPVPDDEFVPPAVRISAGVIATAPGQATVGVTWIVAGTPIDPGWLLSGPGTTSERLGPDFRSFQVVVTESGSYTWTISGTFEEAPGTATDNVTLEVTVGEIEVPEPEVDSATLIARVNEEGTVLLATQQFTNAIYSWSRDDIPIGTSSTPNFEDAGLDPGTYEYEVSITYDRTDPLTGETTRPTITATASATVPEEDEPDVPRFSLGIIAEESGGTIQLTALYRGINADGTPAEVPDDTRYLWTRDGVQIGNTTTDTFTDSNPTPRTVHRYCVNVGLLQACTNAGIGELSVSLTAEAAPRVSGDPIGMRRVDLSWSVSGGTPLSFRLSGGGITTETGFMTLPATARSHQVNVRAPGDYDWLIVASFSNDRSAEDITSLSVDAVGGPCAPDTPEISIPTPTTPQRVNVRWGAGDEEGCSATSHFRIVVRVLTSYLIEFEVGGVQESLSIGSSGIEIDTVHAGTSCEISVNEGNIDIGAGLAANTISVSFSNPVSNPYSWSPLRAQGVRSWNPGFPGFTVRNWRIVGGVVAQEDVVNVAIQLPVRTVGSPPGTSLVSRVGAIEVTVQAVGSTGERSQIAEASNRYLAGDDFVTTSMRFEFVRLESPTVALFTLTLPDILRPDPLTGRLLYGLAFEWNPTGGPLRPATSDDENTYGSRFRVERDGTVRAPYPGHRTSYRAFIYYFIQQGEGFPIEYSNTVTVG